MARSGSASTKAPFLPAGASAFLRRRFRQGIGFSLFVAVAFLALALLSFAPSDPSPNNATGAAVANWMGLAGAWAADILLQTLGLAAAVPVVVLAAWAWRVVGERGLPHFPRHITLLPVAILLGAVLSSTFAAPGGWPLKSGLGGVAGNLLLGHLTALDPTGRVLPATWTGSLVIGAAFLGILLATLAVTYREWRALGAAAWRAVAKMAGWLAAAVLFLARVLARVLARILARVLGKAGAAAPPRPRQAQRTAPRAESKSPGAGPRVGRGPAKLKTGKRVSREAQRDLDLGENGDYQLPSLDLLTAPQAGDPGAMIDKEALEQNARLLETVLEDFGVQGNVSHVQPGPVVTLYELEPSPGTKTSRVIGLADDIARSMSAISARVAVIPGRNAIGIELPNVRRETVFLGELLATPEYERSSAKLTLVLGRDISGAPIIADLARMPHLLIAGTTGSGKSVAVNAMILSLLYRLSPDQCKFIMIDPKMLELSLYEGIPHLLTPVVTDPGKAVVALKWAVAEMEERYRAMSKLGVRNIMNYNLRLATARKNGEVLKRTVQTGFDAETGEPLFEDQELDLTPLPFIVVVVDEMADLMMVAGKDIEGAVQRLAQMARAAGIHLIMATQRPSVDVITGTIKANFPTRISFQVTSKIDSRTILGEQGAEQLLGMGDMLYMVGGGRITRVHGPFVSEEETERIVDMIKAQGVPEYVDSVTVETEPGFGADFGGGGGSGGEELYDQAVALVAREGKASTSFIQRHFQIGYNRAARIIETMETQGVVTKPSRAGKREVLVGDHTG